MPDAEAKAKAEKIAAAKKRVEQLKKAKAKKDGAKAEEIGEVASKNAIVEEKPPGDLAANVDEADGEKLPTGDAIKLSEGDDEERPLANSPPSHGRKPSLSVQSKLRSSSFRQSIASPLLTPGGSKTPSFNSEEDTAPEIYRKQAARIEELEKENKRLTKEVTEGEKRWKKAEEELEDLREVDADRSVPKSLTKGFEGGDGEVDRLRTEIVAIQRQNTQLLAQVSRVGRHGSSPSTSQSSGPSDDLSSLLASKSSTIESMEIDISNLRAQLARTASGTSSEKEQIGALSEQLSRTQKSLDTSQRELFDLKRNLERTTEKAVKEGSERTSAETKLRTLSRETEEAKARSSELQKKVDALEKKVLTLTTLHKENDARSQALKKEREKADKESTDLRHRLASTENESLRLREERERLRKKEAQGIDDEGVDELENEERLRLEAKVRDLEAEVFDLRRGVWREKRGLGSGDGSEPSGLTSPGAKFTEVDLGGMSPSRRRSLAAGSSATKGLTDLFTSSFSNFVGGTGAGGDESLLEDEDDMDFDEEAYRLAQEEEGRKRIERIREVKRKLADWRGWRMDLVELRRGAGEVGSGPIFHV